MIEAERRKRQGRQYGRRLPGRDDRRRAETGGGGSSAGRIGDGGAGEKALRLKSCDEIGEKRGLAAEKMGGAGDVEHQAVRRSEGDQRRVALGPVGDRGKQGPCPRRRPRR